jgi:ABC-type nitrate/sulfonate/bicarbonate transport system substrate-binding protein
LYDNSDTPAYFFGENFCVLKRLLLFLVFMTGLSLLLAGAGCTANQSKADQLTLQLNWYNSAEFAGYYTAEAREFYREANIKLTINQGGPGIAARDYILDGRSDFAIASFDEQKTFVQTNRPSVAIMTVFQIPPLVMFSLADSGIKGPKDVVGKRVGIKNNYWRNIARLTLANAGVDPSGMIEVDVAADAQNMLYERQVDVWMGYAHDEAVKAEVEGYQLNKIFPAEYGVGGYEGLLLVNENRINNNPDLVGRFVRASQKGLQYAVEHPDETAQLLTQIQPASSLQYFKLAVRALGPLVDVPQSKIGMIDPVRWAELMGDSYDTQLPGYSMRFLQGN